MAFSLRETVNGINHLRLKWVRLLTGKPESFFLQKYTASNLPIRVAQDKQGNLLRCSICGYALLELETKEGWLVEMCSALPMVSLHDSKFKIWLSSLPFC